MQGMEPDLGSAGKAPAQASSPANDQRARPVRFGHQLPFFNATQERIITEIEDVIMHLSPGASGRELCADLREMLPPPLLFSAAALESGHIFKRLYHTLMAFGVDIPEVEGQTYRSQSCANAIYPKKQYEAENYACHHLILQSRVAVSIPRPRSRSPAMNPSTDYEEQRARNEMRKAISQRYTTVETKYGGDGHQS